MVTEKIKKLLLLTVVVILPFGQLFQLGFELLLQTQLRIQLLDLTIAVFIVFSIVTNRFAFKNVLKSDFFKVIAVFIFSFIVAYVQFSFLSLSSLLYLGRLCVYVLFGYYLSSAAVLTKIEKRTVFLAIAISIATFGLSQYFFVPDLRQLSILGWDDHYYRLTAPFLDPAFAGILLTLLLLFFSFDWFKDLTKSRLFVLCFLFFALLLTYSRASYLAFATVFSLYLGVHFFKKKVKAVAIVLLFLCSLGIAFIFLPRPGGEGVRLERTVSIFLKIENYQESIELFKKTPIFGLGYNNICEAKEVLLPDQHTSHTNSNSCSGLDNSFLFILTATGLFGAIILLYLFIKWGRTLSLEARLLILALIIHAQFTNTLFYPWVFVWFCLYFAKEKIT